MSRQSEWSKNQIALGNCATCGKHRNKGKRFCDRHLYLDRVKARKRKKCKPWEKGKSGRPPLSSAHQVKS